MTAATEPTLNIVAFGDELAAALTKELKTSHLMQGVHCKSIPCRTHDNQQPPHFCYLIFVEDAAAPATLRDCENSQPWPTISFHRVNWPSKDAHKIEFSVHFPKSHGVSFEPYRPNAATYKASMSFAKPLATIARAVMSRVLGSFIPAWREAFERCLKMRIELAKRVALTKEFAAIAGLRTDAEKRIEHDAANGGHMGDDQRAEHLYRGGDKASGYLDDYHTGIEMAVDGDGEVKLHFDNLRPEVARQLLTIARAAYPPKGGAS